VDAARQQIDDRRPLPPTSIQTTEPRNKIIAPTPRYGRHRTNTSRLLGDPPPGRTEWSGEN
jgi:hypothetical protein